MQMMNKEEETIIRGKKVILAVEGPECDRLLGTKDKQREKGVGTTCVYFSCDKPYGAENAMLYLDGEKYKEEEGRKRWSTTVASRPSSLQLTRQTGNTCVLPLSLASRVNSQTNKLATGLNQNSPTGWRVHPRVRSNS